MVRWLRHMRCDSFPPHCRRTSLLVQHNNAMLVEAPDFENVALGCVHTAWLQIAFISLRSDCMPVSGLSAMTQCYFWLCVQQHQCCFCAAEFCVYGLRSHASAAAVVRRLQQSAGACMSTNRRKVRHVVCQFDLVGVFGPLARCRPYLAACLLMCGRPAA